MPLYDYRCPEGHSRERIRKYDDRDAVLICVCGEPMKRTVSAHHAPVDGIYSYAPNLGSPEVFERKQAKMRGEIPRDAE